MKITKRILAFMAFLLVTPIRAENQTGSLVKDLAVLTATPFVMVGQAVWSQIQKHPKACAALTVIGCIAYSGKKMLHDMTILSEVQEGFKKIQPLFDSYVANYTDQAINGYIKGVLKRNIKYQDEQNTSICVCQRGTSIIARLNKAIDSQLLEWVRLEKKLGQCSFFSKKWSSKYTKLSTCLRAKQVTLERFKSIVRANRDEIHQAYLDLEGANAQISCNKRYCMIKNEQQKCLCNQPGPGFVCPVHSDR